MRAAKPPSHWLNEARTSSGVSSESVLEAHVERALYDCYKGDNKELRCTSSLLELGNSCLTRCLSGVGQSLYSSHLDAVYVSNHAFIDPQIWYDEHEMRKQVEQSAGCFILTAQEKPENARKMRENLFKKTMSADGIAGRRPYGISTRMIELVGWKRYEVNSMVRFSGVTAKDFPSAHRRGVVWLPKARFIDGSIIANQYPDASMDGYFAKTTIYKLSCEADPAWQLRSDCNMLLSLLTAHRLAAT